MTQRRSITIRRFGVLFGLGLAGILTLLLTMLFLDESYTQQAAELGVSLELLVLANGVQMTLLLAVAVLVGLYLAPGLNLTSHVLNRVSHDAPLWRNLRPEVPPALGGGGAVGVVLLVANFIGPEIVGDTPEMTVAALLKSFPMRLLYGGITEELLLRWGVMTVFVFLLAKVIGSRTDRRSPGIFWIAIVTAALLFGVLHLPAVPAIYGPLTVELVGYIVGVNAIGGIIFGWLYWKHSLEAAMIAHGFAHIVAVAGWLVLLLV